MLPLCRPLLRPLLRGLPASSVHSSPLAPASAGPVPPSLLHAASALRSPAPPSGVCVRPLATFSPLSENPSIPPPSAESAVGGFLRNRMGGAAAAMSPGVLRALSLSNASRAEKVNLQVEEAVRRFGRFPKDTGYTPVQVAVLTAKIDALRSHVARARKDKHSMRGLTALVTRRRKLLQYIEVSERSESERSERGP
ncbi:hypothetical protein TeGR_g5763 [Tetraparma gracilis]|uniref:30S ribosomal protein S15 n=1 Tax=Tetraparma gracilis TaxID=2962635 RepID=A0ABQ6MX93_9STRA|nr:hypothetical protein TeGR_g5763 [Tetraparma gracilis]